MGLLAAAVIAPLAVAQAQTQQPTTEELLQLNYEHTSFEGGAADGGDRHDEEAVLTRVAVGF